ncbi:penicillin-binding protein [Prevotella sp. oral taxon 376]|uniref:PASTA domain-containing protein n=1 Tax=Prevotella sp. oral taxon 376 TaxID=712466 RepID=UPI000D1D9A42|nr:PASTA domain-containing protein [Prevotella sp. oral taxon 376]PTL32455.1 penicillin-binding protein [Prevotella sp. oral taxon 376]
MKASEFVRKIMSGYLWANLAAMAMVVVLLCLGVKFGIDLYTHHGEEIAVPDVRHKAFSDASSVLEDVGLKVVVKDTGYVKTLAPDCILDQTPAPGEKVKSGRIVYVTINSPHTPTLTLPDVIDNSSLREAMAKLTSMGFKLGAPEYVAGERDWVYGITVKGRHVVAGDKISVEETLIIQVGNGLRDDTDSVDYIAPVYPEEMEEAEEGEVDEFEEVKAPPAAEPLVKPSAPEKK